MAKVHYNDKDKDEGYSCVCEEAIQDEICENELFEPKLKLNTKEKNKIVDGVTASQWSTVNGDCIIPVENTFTTLKSGYYTIHYSNQIGMYFRYNKIETNKLYRLPNKATDLLLDDISKFWTLEETYKKYNRVFRRNYLLYSAPGTGKTSLINLMCQK